MIEYDPEKLSPELRKELEEAPEHRLYFLINHAGAVRFRVKHDSADNRSYAPSIQESLRVEEYMFQMQRHCMEQLSKLDIVKEPVKEDGTPTEAYWTWFRRWKNHVDAMSNEEWAAFDHAMVKDEDVSTWYPK